MTLIISNEEMNDIMKLVKSLEESGILLKDVSGIIKSDPIELKYEFLSMFLDNLGASY